MLTTYFIADDSLFARMLVKDAVKQINPDASFLEGKSGQEALDAFDAAQTVDWFLLDINMDEPNGMETARMLIERGCECHKITLVTGNKSSELVDQAKTLGVALINKAISPQDVEGFIERLKQFFDGEHADE